MKKLLLLLILIALSIAIYSQALDTRGRFSRYDGFREIAISPSGKNFVGISHDLYQSNDTANDWKKIYNLPDDFKDSDYRSNFFKDVYYLSENTILLLGRIHSRYFLYISNDNGQTWNRKSILTNKDLESIFVNKQGKIWLSLENKTLLYSDDKATSWRTLNSPKNYFCHITFDNTGTIGATQASSGEVTITQDACKTWKNIPMPGKKWLQYCFDGDIAITSKFLFIKQDNRYYYTPLDTVDWKKMPSVEYLATTDSEKIYTVNSDRTISLFHSDMQHLWQSTNKIRDKHLEIVTNGERLYVTSTYDSYHISPTEFTIHPIFTNEYRTYGEPYMNLEWKGKKIGFEEKDIFGYDEKARIWSRLGLFDIIVDKFTLYNDQLIVFDESLENYYSYDVEQNKVSKFDLPEKLYNTEELFVKRFSVEKGIHGHYISWSKNDKYQNMGTHFARIERDTLRDNEYFKSLELRDTIDTKLLSKLLELINTVNNKPLKYSDLEFSTRDIEAYRNAALSEYKGLKEDLEIYLKELEESGEKDPKYEFEMPLYRGNFPFFINYQEALLCASLTDSIPNLSDDIITQSLVIPYKYDHDRTNYSTRIAFILSDDSKIILSNKYYNLSYRYLPWIVEYKGLKVRLNSLEVAPLLDQITDGKLIHETAMDKQFAIHQMVQHIYLDKEENDTLDNVPLIDTTAISPNFLRLLIITLILFGGMAVLLVRRNKRKQA